MLQKIGFAPGINKQVTPTGAELQWIDCDNVRFRYGTPEKIGGWAQLGDITLTGRTTAMHQFVNSDGINDTSKISEPSAIVTCIIDYKSVTNTKSRPTYKMTKSNI